MSLRMLAGMKLIPNEVDATRLFAAAKRGALRLSRRSSHVDSTSGMALPSQA